MQKGIFDAIDAKKVVAAAQSMKDFFTTRKDALLTEIRTKAAIAQIIVKNGKAKGVVLTDGDEIYADIISSSVDPRLTFTKFLEADTLPAEFLEDVNRYKYRGSSGKVNLALDGFLGGLPRPR